MNSNQVVMFRPTGSNELKLVADSSYTYWPPRLPGQPIFYPVTNVQYAREISEHWNVKESGAGYVTRFFVERSFVVNYQIHQVGASYHTEWWIPASDIDQLNEHIIGKIDVIETYH